MGDRRHAGQWDWGGGGRGWVLCKFTYRFFYKGEPTLNLVL